MNYIDLINTAWELREQGIISVHEHDLYNYLLHRCNRLNWKNPFNQSSEVICAILGISRNALVCRRKRLQQLGLITFQNGLAKTRPAEYTLTYIEKDIQSKPDTEHAAEKKRIKRELFREPSLKEVSEYCQQRQNGVNPQLFMDFYRAKNWMIGKNKMIDWQAAVRTWESKQVDNRHNIAKHNKSKSHVKF